jgi:hypothetical protein
MDPTKKELYTAKRSSGVDCSSDTSIASAWERVKADSSPDNWLLLTVKSAKATLLASGNDGVAGLGAMLTDSDVYFGVVRATIRGSMVKFFSVFVVGTDVGGMAKGKASLFKDSIFSNFELHGELVFQDGAATFTADSFCEAVKRSLRASELTIADITF